MKKKPILPLLASMAMPMVLSMLVNSLYNIVDSFFVAKIASAGVQILITAFWGNGIEISLFGTKWIMILIFAICILLLRSTKLNPI